MQKILLFFVYEESIEIVCSLQVSFLFIRKAICTEEAVVEVVITLFLKTWIIFKFFGNYCDQLFYSQAHEALLFCNDHPNSFIVICCHSLLLFLIIFHCYNRCHFLSIVGQLFSIFSQQCNSLISIINFFISGFLMIPCFLFS